MRGIITDAQDCFFLADDVGISVAQADGKGIRRLHSSTKTRHFPTRLSHTENPRLCGPHKQLTHESRRGICVKVTTPDTCSLLHFFVNSILCSSATAFFVPSFLHYCYWDASSSLVL
jgi:hypothetical protein